MGQPELVAVKEACLQYLERKARELSRKTGKKFRPDDVLEMLVEIAVREEAVYDAETGAVLAATARQPVQAARDPDQPTCPSGRLHPQILLHHLRAGDR